MKIKFFFFESDRVSPSFQLMLIKAYLSQLKEMIADHQIHPRLFFEMDELSIHLRSFKPTEDNKLFIFHHACDPIIFDDPEASNPYVFTSCKGKINDDGIVLLNTLKQCEHGADYNQCESSTCFIAATKESLYSSPRTTCYEMILDHSIIENNEMSYFHLLPTEMVLKSLSTPTMQRFNEAVDKEVLRLIEKNRLRKAQRLSDAKYRALHAAECQGTLAISFSELYEYEDNHQESVRRVAAERKNPLTDGVINPFKQAAGSLLTSINFWKKGPSTAELMMGAHVPDATIELDQRTLTDQHLCAIRDEIEMDEKVNRYWPQIRK